MKKVAILIAAVALFVGGYSYLNPNASVGGAGLFSHLQVATSTAVGPQENIQLFAATNNNCRARTISTVASPIMLAFGDPTNGNISSTTVSALVGHLQAASSTVTYSSDDLGCGAWYAYAFASSTITVSNF